MTRALKRLSALAVVALAVQGCGSSGNSSTSVGSSSTAAGSTSTGSASSAAPGGTGGGPGALSAEAKSKATGDIPDNQVFLTYSNSTAGYSITYPEGWTRRGSGSDVTFVNNNNIIHVVIAKLGAPSVTEVQAELAKLKQHNSSLVFTSPTSLQLKGGNAVKATYRTFSAPNAVTGKRVELIVDRYELSSAGKRATIDLATAKGVDNIDAYRKIANSFHWR